MSSRTSLRSVQHCSALRAQNKHTSLFAVGDDWQAIYRFSGAQLS
jgi:DNA helicase-4